MAELDAVWVTTVFAADAEFDVGADAATFGNGDLHELAYASRIERGEGVFLEDFVFGVRKQEVAHVVTADAESGLGKVVGAEAEELSGASDFVRGESTTWDFDHGADQVFKLGFLLSHDCFGCGVNHFHLQLQLLGETNKWDHDLGLHFNTFFGNISSGFEDCTSLHLGDLGVGDAETATAVTKHRVELVELSHALLDVLDFDVEFLGKVHLLLLGVRKELVEWWVEQTDGRWKAFESLEDAGEIFTLIGKKFGKSGTTVGFVVGQNHLAHGVDAVTFEEHVLGAGQADAFCSESHSDVGLLWIVSISADFHAGGLGAPFHEELEVFELLGFESCFVAADDTGDDLGRSSFELAAVNDAGGTVDGEEIALFEGLTGNGNSFLVVVDVESSSTADADFAHLTCYESGVRGNTTFSGEDALSSDHAAKVFGAGFVTNEQHFFTSLFGQYGAVSVEIDFA